VGVKFSLLGSSLLAHYCDFHKLCKTGRAKEEKPYSPRHVQSCQEGGNNLLGGIWDK